MARNIEIKARVADLPRLRDVAIGLSTDPPVVLQQTDTFYRCEAGSSGNSRTAAAS